MEEIKKVEKDVVVEKKEKAVKKLILRNTAGKEVDEKDYFFNGVVPAGFKSYCGINVDREELISVFNKVFKPEDNFLFYKAVDKEVYIVIVPIKYSTTIGDFNNSTDGDFQKHAISFLNEGSVNVETLKQKLTKIVKFCKFGDR